MRKIFSSSALLFGLTFAFVLSAQMAQKRVNASGTVIDSVTRRPVPGVYLHMDCFTRTGPGGSYDAIANEQGAFTFSRVPNDSCAVSIGAFKLASEYRYHYNGSERAEPWIIQLIPRVEISGTVVDENGSPLQSAQVYLGRISLTMGARSQAFMHASTDQQGHFASTSPRSLTDTRSRRIATGFARNTPRWQTSKLHIL